MTVERLILLSGFSPVCIPSPEKEVKGAYVGDLLSWVMGRAEPGNAWITIMSNINVTAVATLADISCVILAEGVTLDENALEAAKTKGINVVSSPLTSYEVAVKISGIIS